MLKKRIITALWGIPLLVAIVWFDTPVPWFTILVAAWGVMAALEFCRLVTASQAPTLTFFGLAWTALFIVGRSSEFQSAIQPYFSAGIIMPLLVTSAVVLSSVWLLRQPKKEKAFAGWAWTLAVIFYAGWLLSHYVALRDAPDGRNWVFYALFVTFASDTAAFFAGRAIGKHRMAPNISPKKTWEGAVGGLFGAVVVSLLFLLPTPVRVSLTWSVAIVLGLAVSVFGQLGDLVESMFKRNMGAKDSGTLIPGHGGVLDRTDSIAFAGIVVYYYLASIGGV